MGSIIETFTGKEFDFEAMSPKSIDIKAIAHSHARYPRYLANTSPLITIGQHCIFVWKIVKTLGYKGIYTEFASLFHDSSEHLCADLPSPLKKRPEMECYRTIEELIQNTIWTAFGIDKEKVDWDCIHKADILSRSYEKFYLKGKWLEDFNPDLSLVKAFKEILLWDNERTEIEFLSAALEIYCTSFPR